MTIISSEISLKPITQSDHKELFALMETIYPSAYAHYWKDDCSWYLNLIYNPEALAQDLNTPSSFYYFVLYRDEPVGVFKIILDCLYPPHAPLTGLKLHRIYLSPTVQGKGLGIQLMNYTEQLAISNNSNLVWLDAMDTHTQAQSFYKKLGYTKTEAQQLDFPVLHDKHRKMWFMHKVID